MRASLVTALALAFAAACGAPAEPRTAATPAERPVPGPSAERPARPAPSTEEAVARSPHVALGVPRDADPSDDYLMDKGQFVLSYSARLNAPNWAAWRLSRGDLGRAPRSPGFHSDDALPAGFYVVRDRDYAGSGYDRGHLCPSADRSSSAAVNLTTFVLSNAHPQLHELNAGPWEELEERERELARAGKDLYIVAGGVFDAEPERIGKERDPRRRVAVPAASYKVIVVLEAGQGLEAVSADTEAFAAVMPNVPEAKVHAWTDYAVSVREVERRTGYDFDGRVPRSIQDAIEAREPRR